MFLRFLIQGTFLTFSLFLRFYFKNVVNLRTHVVKQIRTTFSFVKPWFHVKIKLFKEF